MWYHGESVGVDDYDEYIEEVENFETVELEFLLAWELFILYLVTKMHEVDTARAEATAQPEAEATGQPEAEATAQPETGPTVRTPDARPTVPPTSPTRETEEDDEGLILRRIRRNEIEEVGEGSSLGRIRRLQDHRVLRRVSSAPSLMLRDSQLLARNEDRHSSSEFEWREVRKSFRLYITYGVTFSGGFLVSYMNGLPGQILAMDGVLRRVAPSVFHRKIHHRVDNFCDFVDPRLLVVLASHHVTQLVAVFVGPYLYSRVGRKPTIVASLLVVLLGAIVIIWLPSVYLALSAFTLVNVGVGLLDQVLPIYKSEISSAFPLLYDIGSWFGGPLPVVVVYMTATYQNWAWMVAYGVGVVCSFLVLFLSFFLLESPTFFVEQSQIHKAIKSLQLVEGKENVGESLGKIEILVRRAKAISYISFFSRASRPSLLLTAVSGSLTIFSVADVLQTYGALLFTSSHVTSQSAYLPSLSISAIQFIVRPLAYLISKRYGKRKMLIIAAMSKILIEVVLSLIFYTTSTRFGYYHYPLAILVSGIVYAATNAFLTAPGGWVDEAFPDDLEAIGGRVSSVLSLFQKAIMASVSIIAFCRLNRAILFPLLVWDFVVFVVIWALVPRPTTTEIDTGRV